MRYTRKQTQTQNKILLPRKLFGAIKAEKSAATKIGRLREHTPQKDTRPQNTAESNKPWGSVLVFWSRRHRSLTWPGQPGRPRGPTGPAPHAAREGTRAPVRPETRGKEKPSRPQPAPSAHSPSALLPPRRRHWKPIRARPGPAQPRD